MKTTRRRFMMILNNMNNIFENCLIIEALENELTVSFSNNCQYCIDASGDWQFLAANTVTPAINAGQKLYFKSNLIPNSSDGIGTFTITKQCNLKGNCMSMLFGDNAADITSLEGYTHAFYKLFYDCKTIQAVDPHFLPATTLTHATYCYAYMFQGCTSLVNAPELPATTLVQGCYESMFSGCTGLVNAPELPATTLAINCYNGMFGNCTVLTQAPELPSTTLSDNCYQEMFRDCTSLVTVHELPATTLKYCCYKSMFKGCTSLVTAPELPATTLDSYCYQEMFRDCTSLVTAPELPATTLATYCYADMFKGCTGLVNAPELPATTLVQGCYESMFEDCTGLVNAPELPATTLATYCYLFMFHGCTSLVTAPELPATTLASSCYEYMFYDCTSLITAPELPATTLATSCYAYMFEDCTGLVNAPELPATTLATRCYEYMFRGCTGLTQAPELPATTLTSNCYAYMFNGCTGLVNAPELPATTLSTYCYYYMFYGCSNLNYIKMLATDISAERCLYYWVNGVAGTGTFVKNNNMDNLPTGVSGIPEGWTVKNDFIPSECTSLTITADNVLAKDTNTKIYYTAITNGYNYKNEFITGVILTGEAVSDTFEENMSTTESVTHTISYTFMGVTATTTIIQDVFIPLKYTINLNNEWRESTISNPDSTLYDGVYESYSNYNVNNAYAKMYIDIDGCETFKLYIRSYAESNYDYVMVSQLDQNITGSSSYSNTTLVKAHTRGSQSSGTAIGNYKLVEFTGIDGNSHRITIVYRKDSSSHSGNDRGYVLIPKNQ